MSRTASGRILDVGSGPGLLFLEIGRRNRGLELTGVDVSREMVRIAEGKAERAQMADRLTYLQSTCARLPFRDDQFDHVVSTFSLHFWRRPRDCLDEILRVLNEDGEAWVYDIRRDAPAEAVTKLWRKYGFSFSLLAMNESRISSCMMLGDVRKMLAPYFARSICTIDDRGFFFRILLAKPPTG